MNGIDADVKIRNSNMSKEERDNSEREGFTTRKTHIKHISELDFASTSKVALTRKA